jgi:hypothetical protein
MNSWRAWACLLASGVLVPMAGCSDNGVISLFPLDEAVGGGGGTGGRDATEGASSELPSWRRSCAEPSDSPCPFEAPYCDPSSRLCAECTAHEHCWRWGSDCDLPSGRCLSCLDDLPCAESAQFCNLSQLKCVSCANDSQCEEPGTGCNFAKGECAKKCAGPADCGSEPESHCRVDSGLCVECLESVDCAPGGACSSNGGVCLYHL